MDCLTQQIPGGHACAEEHIQAFADTLLHGTPQLGATVHDGVAAMRAMVAIAQSVRTGERVLLANVSGGVGED